MPETRLVAYLRHPRPGCGPTVDEQREVLLKRALELGQELGQQYICFLTEEADAADVPLFERAQGSSLSELPEGYHVILPDLFAAFASPEDVVKCGCAWVQGGVAFHIYDRHGANWNSAPTLASGERAGAVALVHKFLEIHHDWPRRVRSEVSTFIHRWFLRPYGRRNTLHAGPGYKWEDWPGSPGIQRRVEDPEEMRLISVLADLKLGGATYDWLYFELRRSGIRRADGREWKRTAIQDAVKAELNRRYAAASSEASTGGQSLTLPSDPLGRHACNRDGPSRCRNCIHPEIHLVGRLHHPHQLLFQLRRFIQRAARRNAICLVAAGRWRPIWSPRSSADYSFIEFVIARNCSNAVPRSSAIS